MNNSPDDQLKKNDDEIDLLELFHVLLQGKWIIVSVTAFASICGVLYSLSLPNIYESKSLLAPVSSSGGISGSLGGYASLAGLAGVQLPSSGGGSNTAQAIQKLKSLSFFEENILPNIFLPDLMAFESWEFQTNTLIHNKDAYNKDTDTWVRGYSYPKKQIPSAQESFKAFKGHFNISEDRKTGFLSLKIKHQSPFVAKQWAELVINQVNTYYRQKDKSESEKAVVYLNQKLAMTSLSEVKVAIAELLQQHTKKLTLVEAKEFYVFEFIDPPAVPEIKSEPKRALICIISAILGGLLSILLVFIIHYGFKKKAS